MRVLLLVLTMFITGLQVSAQTAKAELPVKLGLKVSPNLSWMTPETKGYDYDGLTGGATAGLVADIYFARNYALSTGFDFAFLNGKLTYEDSLLVNDVMAFGQMSRKYKFLYLEIPYLIKMQTNPFGNFSFFGQIGFSTGLRLSAKARDQFLPDQSQEEITDNVTITSETTLIRQAVIVGLGLEFHLDESTRIFAGFNYSNSLNNVLKGNNSHSELNQKGLLNFAEFNLGVLF